jgi:hypothetical protein
MQDLMVQSHGSLCLNKRRKMHNQYNARSYASINLLFKKKKKEKEKYNQFNARSYASMSLLINP